jgi:thiamine biosynthesis lipoprotein
MLPADGQPVPVVADIVAETPVAARGAGDVFAFHDPCVLGTRLNLAVTASGQAEAYAAACAARAEIGRLDTVFNWRDADSEISRLNRAGRFAVSADLFAVVAAAEHWLAISGGAVSGRLGVLLDRWRAVAEPDRHETARLAQTIATAKVELDARGRTITRPEVVRFDLDAIAKGYIVDRAVVAAMSVGGVTGVMVDIGGDIRCAGAGPENGRWRVDVPDPLSTFDNAPLAGEIALADAAIATSGCGPRDVSLDGHVRSATLDPRTGWPVAHKRSATAIASSAMDADALATAMLVLAKDEAERLAAQLPGMSARIAHPGGARWFGPAQAHWIEYAPAPQPGQGAPSLWKQGWYANITFEAPPKDMRREIAFRSPYVVIWVSDMNNKPVRTLLLIGRYKEWHEGNHVWWRLNRTKVDSYFAGRSMSTRGSGTYKVYWDGSDDEGAAVVPGKYRLHVETSRESGGHEHRVLDLDFSRPREFEAELPINAKSGGLVVSFQKF